LKLLQNDCATAYLPNPLLTPLELYQAISHDLQLNLPADASMHQLCQGIFVELVRLRKISRPLVVLIDEAQAMPYRSLEALRLLSNLETEKEKLLHILFFAQPEFEQRLADDDLRQLRQRITFSYTLTTLHQRELSAYLAHRLQVAGYVGQDLFTPAAVRLLSEASGGIPRVINLLAHKAMLAAYGKGVRQIERKMVAMAIKDTTGGARVKKKLSPLYLLEFGLLMAIAVATLLAWGRLQ
jgi:MSHA biogenesis protein MshM